MYTVSFESHLPGGNETILIVDDELVVRRVTAQILNQLGYRTLEAASGAEALRLLASQGDTIDLVLTDLMMPGMNGVDLGERIHHSYPDLPIIYFSGYAEEELRLRLDCNYRDRFLAKPFDASALASMLRDSLDAKRYAGPPGFGDRGGRMAAAVDRP